MTDHRQHRRSHLFTVRLWIEPVGADHTEVRGGVQHVLSGETRYFRTWPELSAFLEAKLAELETESSDE